MPDVNEFDVVRFAYCSGCHRVVKTGELCPLTRRPPAIDAGLCVFGEHTSTLVYVCSANTPAVPDTADRNGEPMPDVNEFDVDELIRLAERLARGLPTEAKAEFYAYAAAHLAGVAAGILRDAR